MSRVFGIDISYWQTDYAPSPSRWFNPEIAKEKGVQFAFLRVSDGAFKDTAFDRFAETFNKAGIPVGFYHFLRPHSWVSYITQADKFLERIKPHKFQLPPVLDVEASGLGLDIVRQWCGRVSSKLGVKPIIYTAPNPWNTYTGVANATWVLEYDYWVANYMKLSSPVYGIPDSVANSVNFPTPLLPWSKHDNPWTFWQYTASGNGEHYGGDYDPRYVEKVGLDLNCFNGDLESFNKKFNLTATPPTEPEEPPIPPTDEKQYVKTNVYLRGRTTPQYIAGQSALVYPPNEKLEVADMPKVYEPASGITWQPIIMYVSDKYITEV